MARIGVNYRDIEKAAVQITAQNKVPTVDGVRAILGTGSKSTIAPLLKTWKERQAGEEGSPPKSKLPGDLLISVNNLYEAINQQANEKIEKIQAHAKDEVESSRQALLQVQKANKELQSQLIQRASLIEKLQQENKAVHKDLSKEQQAHALERNQHEASRERLSDRDQEVTRLHTQLKQAQQNLDHYRNTVQKQREQERAETERQRLAAEQAQQHMQQKIQTLQERLEHTEAALASMITSRDQLQDANQALTQQNQQYHEEIQMIQQNLATLTGRYEVALENSKAADIKIQTLNDQMMQLEKQAAAMSEKVDLLTTMNQHAEGKIENLQSQNTLLAQEKANIQGQFKQLQRSLSK